jgi:8-oxo-dGTP diphosphatase
MAELLQLYDEQGRAITEKGGLPEEVGRRALLHGSSHVWIWRVNSGKIEILLQKRAATKRTWPNYYDISAAGHIDFGDDPLTAATRETKEEVGVNVRADDLKFIGIYRRRLAVPGGVYTENELCWLYTLELSGDIDFSLQRDEVESIVWQNLEITKADIKNPKGDKKLVPHGGTYFNVVFEAIKAQAK